MSSHKTFHVLQRAKKIISMHSYLSYLNWIESQKTAILQKLRKWVSINTFSWNIEGLNQLSSLLQSDFEILGGKSRFYPLLPQKTLIEGHFETRPLAQALRIFKRPEAPIQILLGGHIDTVYPLTNSFQNIEEKELGIWKGPGVADMKGGIAILLLALAALEQSPLASKIGWEVLLTPDEEIGSPGSAFLYEEAARRHQLGLIFEPSFPDGAFVSQRKGSTTYSIVVHGRAAHVGRDFAQGRSSVFALAHFIHCLNSWDKDHGLTINVADVEGTGPVNIVPPLASCRVNFRCSRLETLQTISTRLDQLAQACSQEGIRFDIVEDSFRTPKPFDSQVQRLFDAYESCAQDLHLPFQVRETGGVCDGNILAGAGLPALDTAGAVGGALHTSDEYLILSSLIERAKLTALFLFKLAAGEITFHKEGTS